MDSADFGNSSVAERDDFGGRAARIDSAQRVVSAVGVDA
jgi:hypothetical protein